MVRDALHYQSPSPPGPLNTAPFFDEISKKCNNVTLRNKAKICWKYVKYSLKPDKCTLSKSFYVNFIVLLCQFYAEKLLHVCNNIFEHGVDANTPASPPPFQQLCCTVEVKVTGAISGCELVYRNCDYGVSAAIWVQYKNNNSGCKLATLFDSYCDSGVNILHKCGKSGGCRSCFLAARAALYLLVGLTD